MKAREARPGDRPAIEALVNTAYYTSPALWRWDRHLPDEGFIVVEGATRGERGRTYRIHGALLASSDASPVAWIRLAAVDHDLDIGRWLDLSLPPILRALSSRGVRELAWMDHGEWAHTYLKTHGFSPLVDVITLSKTDRHLPNLPAVNVAEPPAVSPVEPAVVSEVEPTPQGIILRPATDADIATIASIDRAAFEPHWWRSEATLRRRAATASRFTVAECQGEVVGYTEQELHLPAAHLNRIAIHPCIQGRGAGKVLLHHVLSALWQGGARTVSLNTQRHNQRSRRLYHCFGFQPTGDVVTVWTLRPIVPQPPPAPGPSWGRN